MPSLYIVANQIAGSIGHLQMVRANGTTWSGSTEFKEVEVQAPTFVAGNWDFRTFGQPYGTSGAAAYYSTITLAASQTADYVWQLAGQIHASMKITGAELDYSGYQNSNSFIRTLLYVIGNDENWSAKFSGVGLTSFPGWPKNVLFGAELGWTTSTGIALNLAGTAGNDIIRTGNGNDTLGGAGGNDSIRGGAGADTIHGGSGMDTLFADTGQDRLYGDGGTDFLYGGTDSAADVFIFVATTDSVVGVNRDRIYNFSSGSDDIDLSVIDANSAVSGNQSFSWGATTAKANGVWITFSSGSAIVNGDINGDKVADFQIQLYNISSVSSADFVY